jgi:hypothetical protein
MQASRAELFKFNWPAPAKASITQKTEMEGVSIEIKIEAAFAKRPQVNGYAFAIQDTEIVAVKGAPKEKELDFILANAFWPTYLISDTGGLLGVSGMETLTENLLVLSNELDSTDQAEDIVRSEEFQAMLKERVIRGWESLIGAVAGIRLESGEIVTKTRKILAYGVEFPVHVRIEHLGPSEEVAGAVKLRTIIDYDQDELKLFTKKAVSRFIGSEASNSVAISKLRRRVTVDSVVTPETLLLHSSVLLEEVSIEVDEDTEMAISQRQVLKFDWVH